jgi:hypothetical protein
MPFMNQDTILKQEEIFKKYPSLFKNKDLPPSQTCMCWGIDCGEGWFVLVDELCKSINSYEKSVKCPNYQSVSFDQIKEKFGTLRVYFSGGDAYIEGLVAMAEQFSGRVCEKCGNQGKIRGTGWIRTLCDDCHEEMQK